MIATKTASKRKTLVFHIGDQKAGSTSIQNAFTSGHISFPEHKVLYPGHLSHNYLSNHFTAFAKTGELLASQPGNPNLEKLAHRFRDTNFDFAVISGEQFEGVEPNLFHQVLTTQFDGIFDEIRVICYLRPHAPRITSSFSEAIKIGNYHGDLDQFHKRTLQRQRFFYAPRLRKWRDLFGTGFIVRPMIPSVLKHGSILQDFVLSGLGPIQFDVDEPPRANESLGLEDLMLLKLLQSHLKNKKRPTTPHQMVGRLIARMITTSPRPGGSTKVRLHRALAEEVLASYIADARAVDAEFMEGLPLFETELTTAPGQAAEAPQEYDPETFFPPDELRNLNVLAATISDMLDKDDTSWTNFFRQKRIDDIIT